MTFASLNACRFSGVVSLLDLIQNALIFFIEVSYSENISSQELWNVDLLPPFFLEDCHFLVKMSDSQKNMKI